MTPTKKIITVFITAAAIAGCFISFKKEGKAVIEKQTVAATTTSVVKGASQSAATLALVTDYSASAMAAHLELTPSNVIWFTNYERAINKVAPLASSPQLNRSSSDKVADMFAYQYFDHTRPGSPRGFDVFFDKENYDYIKIGENLAMGNFKTSKEVVDAWMKSPEHRRNILDPVYTNIGVSVESGTFAGNQTFIIVINHCIG